jgi:(R,R)-butanediol dehydrogenase/meso-butanediol dehydrogenase/diacetyl reductase
VEEVDNPDPGPEEVRVKIKYCGICGSDVHEYLHGSFAIPQWGHEACGEIVDKGDAVTTLDIGDRVLTFGSGAYAEYFTAPATRMRKLEQPISWERATVIEPLAGIAYAVKRGQVTAEDTVLITGAGPIGLLFLAATKALGVETVYMTEISESRAKKAEEMGVTAVLNPANEKVPARIRELTGGTGVDIAIEAVGIGPSLKDCLASTRYRGRVVVHGIFTERVPLHMLGFVSREITMIGTNSIDIDQALEWAYAGDVEPEKIISNMIPLAEIDEKGFQSLTTPNTADIKVVVVP